MQTFYALVDAVPGMEEIVSRRLSQNPRVLGVARIKEKSFDFLIRFTAEGLDLTDNFLQSEVRPIGGVVNVEIVTDLDDYGNQVRDAARALP